jgi:hypothetical protein
MAFGMPEANFVKRIEGVETLKKHAVDSLASGMPKIFDVKCCKE